MHASQRNTQTQTVIQGEHTVYRLVNKKLFVL